MTSAQNNRISTRPRLTPSVDSTNTTIYTPSTSPTLSPHISPSPAASYSRDDPIPSVETQASTSPDLPDMNDLRIRSPSNTYDNVTISFGQLNIEPLTNTPQAYQFGESAESRSFTFRNLHNITPSPEPSVNLDPRTRTSSLNRPITRPRSRHARLSASGDMNRSSPPRNAATLSTPPLSRTQRASSAPAQSQASNLPLRSWSYNTNDEIPPTGPYFNEEFQRALHDGKSVTRRIANTLATCELAQVNDSQIFDMIQTANELSQFDASPVCTIGIAGDSGVGKSSLINSLLHEEGLAYTDGLGYACTSIVTEYRLRRPGQAARYAIEMDRMTNHEIDEQLHELLWSYRRYHLTDLREDGISAEEENRLLAKSELAWNTLKAAFPLSRELTEHFLQDTTDGAVQRIERQLRAWTEAFQWPGRPQDDAWFDSAETAADCRTKTEYLLTGNLWPFIKVIRIFLNSQALRSGVILADLPGLHDSNNARVRAAERYINRCDEIFVVAAITRAATNNNVKRMLELSISSMGAGRPSQGITLVCTRSDDFDEGEIKRKFFRNNRTPDGERLRQLEHILEQAEANNDLHQREGARDQINDIFITVRNNHIKSLIATEHPSSLNGNPLSVFCVSNKLYRESRNGVIDRDLRIKTSGIPALRRHCHGIPAKAQFRIAHHFLTVRLRSLVQRVQLWLAGGSEEFMPNNAAVQRLLDALQNDLRMAASNSISAAEETQRSVARNMIIQPISNNLGDWTLEALGRSQSWNRLHHTQVGAFIRNYGSWGRGTIKYTEWNLELIEKMVESLSPCWDDLLERLKATFDELREEILRSLYDLRSQVTNFHGAPQFAEAMTTHVESVDYIFLQVARQLDTSFNIIKRDATENHQSAYIHEEMRSAYRDCQIDSGFDVTPRRLRRLTQAIGTARNPVLFMAIRSRIQKALVGLIQDMKRSLEDNIRDVLRTIATEIEMLRGSEARVLAANGNFLERLGDAMHSIVDELDIIEGTAASIMAQSEAQPLN